MLLAKQVDGLIVFPTGKNKDVYQRLVEERFPLVFVDRMVPGIEADAILLDNKRAAALAVEYLASNGYERIGVVAPPLVSHVVPRVERIEGFRQTLTEKGLPVIADYVVAAEISSIQSELAKLFALGRPPQALFAINDLTLMEILHFVKNNGIHVPDDLALISVDDVPFADIYTPTLTTIAQPTFAMGKKQQSVCLCRLPRNKDTSRKFFVFRLH